MSTTTPVVPEPQSLSALGIGLPWMGAAAGGFVGAGADLISGRPSNWRRTLRKGLTGAAAGVGGELGLRLGGELARRHAVAGGGPVAVGLTPVIGALGGGAAGYFAARDHDDDEAEE